VSFNADLCSKYVNFFGFVQTPFIAFYRKEHIDPELTIKDLWTVYRYDEKVCVSVCLVCELSANMTTRSVSLSLLSVDCLQ